MADTIQCQVHSDGVELMVGILVGVRLIATTSKGSLFRCHAWVLQLLAACCFLCFYAFACFS